MSEMNFNNPSTKVKVSKLHECNNRLNADVQAGEYKACGSSVSETDTL